MKFCQKALAFRGGNQEQATITARQPLPHKIDFSYQLII